MKDTSTEREPMLTDSMLDSWSAWDDGCDKQHAQHFPKAVRDWYESKITSGELRVVNRVGVEMVPNNYDRLITCTGCRDGVPYYLMEEFDDMNYCPNCGSEIKKPNK